MHSIPPTQLPSYRSSAYIVCARAIEVDHPAVSALHACNKKEDTPCGVQDTLLASASIVSTVEKTYDITYEVRHLADSAEANQD